MQTEAVGSSELAVVAGDVLALRGAGLAAPETWALLCQAAQALQDLFLSNGGVVGGSGVGPVVTPHTLELTPRGRVILRSASPEAARAYLPPEYRPGRVYSDTDSEKMWMFSLGRALLDTTPRISALTGSVSVSPSSALQSVLSAMTEPDPHRRASLMNLLDVISEYCRTRLQSKPFTHIVMDMYREVTRSGQYMARKRAAFPALRSIPGGTQRPHQRQNEHQAQSHQHNPQHPKQQQQQQTQQPPGTGHFSKHQVKGALFKAQSRNSRSHPNLLSLSGHEPTLSGSKAQFQSQIDIQTGNTKHPPIHHARTNSQPEYSERVQRGLTTHAKSTHNLIMLSNGQNVPQTARGNNLYSDPIYAQPVKPFLSSQDVRGNGLLVKSNMGREDFYGQTITGRPRTIKNGGASQPNLAHLARASNNDKAHAEDIRGKHNAPRNGQTINAHLLHRQYSNPQLPTRNYQESIAGSRNSYSQSNGAIAPPKLCVFSGDKIDPGQVNNSQNNLMSSMKVPSIHGPVPPKPPRLMTTLKRSAVPLPQPNNGLNESVAPAKPPRLAIKNGPRARRGRPVQRAPSRLYRTIGGPARSFNKNQCVGPEFVVRANQPPKLLCVGDVKASSSGRIVVILLSGQRIEVTCDPQKITAGELFQAIVQAESLDENFTLGLAALLAGDFAMLPPETKLNKVAPPGWLNSGKSKGTLGLPTSFMLYLRLRFFLPSLRGTRSWISKHLLYLQIRRCILEQQLVCPLAQLINLTGFALQAEFGNYNVNEHGRGDYFLLEHYIPESLILNPELNLQKSQEPDGPDALRSRLHQAHRDRRGLDANNAEEMFIIHAQALPDYGSHYYIATADNKELTKIMDRLKKCNSNRPPSTTTDVGGYACTENPYQLDASSDCHVYGKIEFNRINSSDNVQRSLYTGEEKLRTTTKATNANEDIYAMPTSTSVVNLVETNNNSNSNKLNKSKKSESNVWLAIHAQGLKLFERGGRPRDRNELARLQWRDIQTLSYSKNSFVVYTRFNGKRCKFKLRMDHKKSYYAFKLTSLHHQFFLKLRSEVTSLHGLAKDFGVPLMVEPISPPLILVPDPSKPKKTIVNSGNAVPNSKYPMQLEEYQNKENENPQKVVNPVAKREELDAELICYTPEEDALYAQVNARLEPEGASRDTEDESDRALASRNCHFGDILKSQRTSDEQQIYSYPKRGPPSDQEALYSTPKPIVANAPDRTDNQVKHPEELYAAINKTGNNKKRSDYPVPEEVWDVTGSKKNLHKVKTSSLPNYGTPRQNTGFRTPSLPRRLGVKMGTRAIYSTVVQRDSDLTDDLESLSVKSDTASSIQSASVHSNDSPMPEAYVLNADIRTDDETFRIGNDDTMSASLLARLEELSFAEERILYTIQVERGHGGSIGLQVTEGNDGGVYVQAVSVGGSADMAGNINKGDKIVAINGQSLLNLRYEEALPMLQSSSETVELVLSQVTSNRNRQREQLQEQTENNYLQNLRFEISSEAETSSMTTKWLSQGATDVASVQNTSSAYSSAPSSSMSNHNTNNMYLKDSDSNALNSASMLLSLSDFDVSLEIGVPPPVPPRRRKRKTDIIAAPKPIVRTKTSVKDDKGSLHNGSSRPERKPRSLPPPPPVPRTVIPHRTKPRTSSNDYLAPASADNVRTTDPEVISDQVKLPSKPLAQGFTQARTKPRFTVTQVTSIEKDLSIAPELDPTSESHDNRSGGAWDYRNENRSGRSSPMPQNYSPLFFTIHDFESVMAHSSECDKSLSQQFETIATPDKSTPNLITAFIENSNFHESNDENEEQVCFRVTTTNVPFEKCLGDWNVPYDSGAFDHQFEDTDDHYIFEDYMDHRQNPKLRSTAAAFLFDDNTFPNFATEEPTSFHSATKVRFVIESPTASTLDPDTPESFSNFDSLVNDDEITNESSVIITEITETTEKIGNQEAIDGPEDPDEFGDVPFSSLIENELNIDGNSNFCESVQSEQFLRPDKVSTDGNFNNAADVREEKNCHIFSRPRSTPSPRFMSPKKHRIDPIPDLDEILMPALPPTYDPRDEGFVKKVWDSKSDHVAASPVTDRSSCLKNSSKTSDASESSRNAREAFLAGKLRMTSYDDLDSPVKTNSPDKVDTPAKSQDTKQRIFIDAALRNFIEDDEDDMDWKELSDEEDGEERSTRDSRLSNLDDRKELVETAQPKVLNRDTCQEHRVSPDKHPRPFRTADRENKECNQEKLVEDEELDVMRSSELLYGSVKKDERTSVPVTVRRNSFLENMLVDDDSILSLDPSVPCAIIAAHPKSMTSESIALPPREVLLGRIDKSSSPLGDSGRSSDSRPDGQAPEQKAMESGEKQLKKETGARMFGSEPKIVGTTAPSSASERIKSTGEAKIDVLSELLSNFSAIKLKSVEPPKRQLILCEIDEGEMMMGIAEGDAAETIKSVERLKVEEAAAVETIRGENKFKVIQEGETELKEEVELSVAKADMSMKPEMPLLKRPSSLDIGTRVSAKTDDHNNCREIDDRSAIIVITSMEAKGLINEPENVEKIMNSNTHCGIKTLENRDKINVYKCAIDRNINNPQIRRNNNDNNAMTPVDLSNDQKPRDAEVSAITPGSVRSFVELYEIQHEKTSEHSKNNYSLPVAKTRTRTRCFKGLWDNAHSESTEQFEQDDSENARAKINTMKVIKAPEVEVSEAQTLGELKLVEKSESNEAVRLKVLNRVPPVDQCLGTKNSAHADQSSGRVPVPAKRRTQESCLKISNELSPRSEVKKTVTFYNDCEAKNTENERSNESVIIDRETVELDGRPKTSKRRAPPRPADELGAIENLDCVTGSTVKCDGEFNPSSSEILSQGQRINPAPFPRSAVNLFAAQVHQAEMKEDEKDCSIKPGTATSTPNSEVPQLRQPYVFYCRV